MAEMTPSWPGSGPQTLDSGVHLDPQTQAWRPGCQFAGLMGKADPSAMLTERPGHREPGVPQARPHPRLHCPSPPARLAWPGGPRGCFAPGPSIRASREVASIPGRLAVGSRGLVAKPSQEKTSDARVPSDVHGDPLCKQQSPQEVGVQGLPGRARAPELQKPHWAARTHAQNAGSRVTRGTKPPVGERSGQPRACLVQPTAHLSRVCVCLAHVSEGTSPAEHSALGVSARELVRDTQGGPLWVVRGGAGAR